MTFFMMLLKIITTFILQFINFQRGETNTYFFISYLIDVLTFLYVLWQERLKQVIKDYIVFTGIERHKGNSSNRGFGVKWFIILVKIIPCVIFFLCGLGIFLVSFWNTTAQSVAWINGAIFAISYTLSLFCGCYFPHFVFQMKCHQIEYL